MATTAINTGGSAVTTGGTSYLADQFFSGGQTFSVTAPIDNTTDDALYQDERFGSNFSYAIPLANGNYNVTLKFSENYFNAPGQRIFDVNAEGNLVIDNLDVWSAAGGENKALDVVVPVSVQDGTLNLQFLSSVNNALIDAIRIAPAVTSGTTNTAVNTGGSAVTASGTSYLADQFFSGGQTYSVTAPIANTADDALYQDERFGSNFSYAIPVANGTYNVTLKFSENYFNAPGQRIFDVNAEGNLVIDNLDVWSAAGGKNTALDVVVPVTVQDGTLNLQFLSSVNNALIDAISVAPTATSGTAVNTGGGAVTASGTSYLADQFFSGGQTYSVTAPIANTTDDALYQDERFGSNFSYAVPLANGNYNVTLKFAENFFDAPGQRVFDVNAEGKLVIDNLDVWSAAGGKNRALDVVVPVSVQDGTLNLQFLSSVNNALIDAIRIAPAGTSAGPAARLSVTPGAGIGGSTYNSNSFVLENLSTGGQQLTSVTIDLSGSILTGMVYDPTGQAGDTVAKPFTIDGQVGSFTVVGATLGGGSDTAGYKTLTLQLQNFNPGDTLSFSIDVDPHSIQGSQQQVGPDGTITGAVAGVELTGAATTFNFGGTTISNELFKESTSVGGATVLAEAGLPSAPTVTVTGVSGATGIVSSAQQTVNVSGPANGTVRVLVMEGGAFTQGVPSTAPKLGPFQANSAVKVTPYDVALDGQGHGQVQVTLTDSVPEGGINLITAATMATDGAFGPASTPIALELGTSATTTPHFTQSTLSGLASGNYTSLQFGPDGRLYVSEVDGTILALTIQATSTGYQVAPGGIQTINVIKNITNYNDDGTLAAAAFQGTRQVTGILLPPAPTTGPLVMYVSSSDPRIGGGTSGGDVNLDTNSGVISRLTQQPDGSWQRVDLVRGLPRSEENHSVNGMQLSADGKTLYLAVGGNTNKGAPSAQFAYLPEDAYSAAILSIDLTAIDAMPTKTDQFGNAYKYNLPTLPAASTDPFPNDPFGGQDGLSQAVIQAGSPVQIYSPGYRNPYDLVLTQSGKLYTIDNGANSGWGDLPSGVGTANVTNAPEDGGTNTFDSLHLVTLGAYGGHPDPIRANPSGAGWYLNGSSTPVANLPAGWPPVKTADPIEANFGAGQNTLYASFQASTDGLTEYTASTFGGAMEGNLLATSFDDQLYRIQLSSDGTQVVAVTPLTDGSTVLGGGSPLDVTTRGDGQTFAGDIFVANYGGGITVFTPSDQASPPPSSDTDNDGLPNNVDAFAEDSANGKNTDLASGQTLVWNFSQNTDPPGPNAILNMGFTGLMTNGTDSYTSLYDPANIIAGGAAAGFQVKQVSTGDALQGNTQQNGFQFGVNVQPGVKNLVIETKMDNPFGGTPGLTPAAFMSQGIYIGSGDQDNYTKIVVSANNGAGGIEVGGENAGVFSSTMYSAGVVGPAIGTLDTVTLRLTVDTASGIATPSWVYTVGGVPVSGSGAPIQLSGATLSALRGTYTVGGLPSALAVGIISTSFGSTQTFPALWQSVTVSGDPLNPPPALNPPTALDLAAVDDTGSSSTDNITRNTSGLTISGAGTTGATVTLFDDINNNGTQDAGEATLASAPVNGGLFTTDITLTAGTHHVRAFQTGATGNKSASSTNLDITVDTTAPIPTITGESLSSNGKVTLGGTSEAGSVISIFDGSTQVGTTTSAANGTWSFTSKAVSNTAHTFTVKATDAAGNQGSGTNAALLGSNSADTLVGTSGLDIIIGNGGNDRITGAGGGDTLTGSAGADTFLFGSPNQGPDILTDFTHLTDKIGVSAAGFGIGLSPGTPLPTDYFVAGTAATQTGHGQFLYDSGSGQLWWDMDGAASAAKVLLGTLGTSTHPTLTTSDFLIT